MLLLIIFFFRIQVFVSAVISRYMEAKARRKSWAFFPTTGELFMTQKAMKQEEESDNVKEKEDFFSVDSRFSRCSSTTNKEEFLSAKSNLSRCSSLSRLDFPDFERRSIILELCHCEGWPFGLCRKVLLLPPLPKTPSEPWSWRKSRSARLV